MIKASKSFVCRGFTDQPARTYVDIGDGASLKIVDKFCYLFDMLSIDGDADAAAEARVWKQRCNVDLGN